MFFCTDQGFVGYVLHMQLRRLNFCGIRPYFVGRPLAVTVLVRLDRHTQHGKIVYQQGPVKGDSWFQGSPRSAISCRYVPRLPKGFRLPSSPMLLWGPFFVIAPPGAVRSFSRAVFGLVAADASGPTAYSVQQDSQRSISTRNIHPQSAHTTQRAIGVFRPVVPHSRVVVYSVIPFRYPLSPALIALWLTNSGQFVKAR